MLRHMNRISDLHGEYQAESLAESLAGSQAEHRAEDRAGYAAGRRVRLFRNGRNQAIRIPREMELPGEEAMIYQHEGRLIIEPVQPTSLLALLATWEPLEEEFPEIEDAPPEPVEL
jgi:antitoxin VapB